MAKDYSQLARKLYSLRLKVVEYKITLFQIGLQKTLYLGQHNEDGTLINPIMPLNTLSLGLFSAYEQFFDPVIWDSKLLLYLLWH
jgi:hypothetical protein